jgi:SAM-dependent methyltransferase
VTLVAEARQAALRSACGRRIPLHVDRWFDDARPEERAFLMHAIAPVLDVGCGPGRHVVALNASRIAAVGLDHAPSAIALATERGAPAIVGSIFDPVPAEGRWGTALLLDGNVGIGGDPVRLLARVREILRPGGRALVELDAPGTGTGPLHVRAEVDGAIASPWFAWALVGADDVGAIAETARFSVLGVSTDDGRWFARLEAR